MEYANWTFKDYTYWHERLSHTDWDYQYSDDPIVWSDGRNAMEELMEDTKDIFLSFEQQVKLGSMFVSIQDSDDYVHSVTQRIYRLFDRNWNPENE